MMDNETHHPACGRAGTSSVASVAWMAGEKAGPMGASTYVSITWGFWESCLWQLGGIEGTWALEEAEQRQLQARSSL